MTSEKFQPTLSHLVPQKREEEKKKKKEEDDLVKFRVQRYRLTE